MNVFSGVGNLTRDPESSVTSSGVDVCKFTIAINRPKGPNEESQADFIPVRAYKRLAAICREYLRKGSKVAVVGKLQTYMYTAQDGSRRSGFEVLANEVTFLPSANPNSAKYGDIHSDMYGAAHHDLDDPSSGFTQVEDYKLPF